MGIGGIIKLFSAVAKAAKTTAIVAPLAAAADGAAGTNYTAPVADMLPDWLGKPLNLVHTAGTAGRKVADVAVEGTKKITDMFNVMSDGKGLALGLGGLIASSMFLGDGIMKSVAQLACFASMLYFGYKMASSAGWLPDSFKNAVEGIMPFMAADKPAADADSAKKPVLTAPALTPQN